MFRAETEIPILTRKMFITHASKGRIPVPNLMNFRKNFEGGGGGVISDPKNFVAKSAT